MRRNSFHKKIKYYHLNFEFQTHPLFKELDWIFVQQKIKKVVQTFPLQILAVIMLDTHLHVLISSEEKNENFFCEQFKNELAPAAKIDCFCEPIDNYSQFLNTYKYLYRNSVEAGLCKKVEDYPFSSLRIILGQSVGYVQIDDPLGVIQNPMQILKWLNTEADFKISQLSFLRQDNSPSI